MTLPEENSNTDDAVEVSSGAATATVDLGDDWKCDVDGNRMEVEEKRTVGPVTYSVRRCSANPAHTKMIPV